MTTETKPEPADCCPYCNADLAVVGTSAITGKMLLCGACQRAMKQTARGDLRRQHEGPDPRAAKPL